MSLLQQGSADCRPARLTLVTSGRINVPTPLLYGWVQAFGAIGRRRDAMIVVNSWDNFDAAVARQETMLFNWKPLLAELARQLADSEGQTPPLPSGCQGLPVQNGPSA